MFTAYALETFSFARAVGEPIDRQRRCTDVLAAVGRARAHLPIPDPKSQQLYSGMLAQVTPVVRACSRNRANPAISAERAEEVSRAYAGPIPDLSDALAGL